MNSTHHNGGNGRPLDEELGEVGRAYARLGAEEPPELLDLAIRNAARRAVEKQPRRIKFGWLHGLTTAAVFVLALSVIIHQRENRPAAGDGQWFAPPQPAELAIPARKQSSDAPAGQVPEQAEEAAGAGMELAAPAAAPASAARDETLGETVRESRQAASAGALRKTAAADTDEERAAPEENVGLKEADKRAPGGMAASAQDAGQAAAVAAPPPAEPEARSDIDLLAERQLQAIIAMKRDGDENWKAELQAFIENHPGYPLPDELKD